MAAYFARNANPKKIPNDIKFIVFGFFFIFTNSFKESVQKSKRTTSVLIIQDENETEGINKNKRERCVQC